MNNAESFSVEVIATAERFEIKTEADLKSMTDTLSRIKLALKELDTERKSLVAPLNHQVKFINDKYKPLSDALEKARRICEGKAIDYHRAEEERIRKEQSELRRQETLRQKEIERKQAKLAAKGIEVKLSEQPTEKITLDAPAKTTVGIYSKMTIKKTPAFRLVDISKVPEKYLLLNEVAVNAAARAGVKTIAGLEWFEKETVMNR